MTNYIPLMFIILFTLLSILILNEIGAVKTFIDFLKSENTKETIVQKIKDFRAPK